MSARKNGGKIGWAATKSVRRDGKPVAAMPVVSSIWLTVPSEERHVQVARRAASLLATDPAAIRIEIEGENRDCIVTSFSVPKARQLDVCDRIADTMAMDMPDFNDQGLSFPRTEAEERRARRKLERAKERRRLARQMRGGKGGGAP